ncbi:MAG: LPS export ABC transporter permease LptF [Rhodobacteraceae bacterium]|nr:MAG: LPS export ABC transporter permease LptF [Paracoccaceae bacterium]
MSRYDRYVLSQLLWLFGFFALVLVAVFWINRAVSLFDRLIADGQSAMVFLEFSALGLPNLIRIVLPIAAFAASVYVTNRLSSESELTIMRATGASPWRMARPYALFGLIAAAMMSFLTHLALPASIDQLALREAEVSQNSTARLLTEGTFLHPTAGVTFYIREIEPNGTLRDVYLSDRRDPEQTLTYTASTSYLVRTEEGASLIMVQGMAQRLAGEGQTLSVTNFSELAYDISSLIRRDAAPGRNLRAIPTAELLTDPEGLVAREGRTRGELAEELHLRFARALICVSVALIGYGALILGGHSRFGVWRQIVLAVVLLILLELLRGVVTEPVMADHRAWPLIYLPALVGLAIAAVMLQVSGRPLFRSLSLRRAGAAP